MNPLKCPRVPWIGIQVIEHVETYHLGFEDTDKLLKIRAFFSILVLNHVAQHIQHKHCSL